MPQVETRFHCRASCANNATSVQPHVKSPEHPRSQKMLELPQVHGLRRRLAGAGGYGGVDMPDPSFGFSKALTFIYSNDPKGVKQFRSRTTDALLKLRTRSPQLIA